MTKSLQAIARARTALMQGRPQEALLQVETLLSKLRSDPPAADGRAELETHLSELRSLAEAALEGTQAAIRQIDEVIAAARSLRTYDSEGRRKVTNIAEAQTHRF